MNDAAIASLEGSIFTPEGWVTGRVEIEGPAISRVTGQALAEGESPTAPT